MISKNHFMHQAAHALVLNINTSDYNYLCYGCKTPGNGKNFRCQPCNFDMHEFCIDCPRELASFLHPQHSLSLLVQNSQFATSLTTCDVCGDSVNGLFYCCQYCNFNVHPVCTQFPRFLRHAVHGLHYLAFQKPKVDAACRVCGGVCDSWRYRCGECDGFDVHVDCVIKPCVTTSTFTPPPSAGNYTHQGSTSRRLPPYAGTYTYGGVTGSPSPSPSPNPNLNLLNKYNPTYAYYPDPHNMYNSNAYYNGAPYGCPHHVSGHNNYCCGWPCSSDSQIFHNGMPPNTDSYSTCMSGMPYNANSCHMYDTNGEMSYGSNMQNVHSHHVQAQNVQCNSSQGHGSGKMGSKIFKIVSTLTLGVVSNIMFGALVALV